MAATTQATPLAIGPLTVDPPVVLAPMAGVTNQAFRQICRGFGAGLYVSEMITARAVVERNERTLSMLSFGDDERPRSAQLYGADPASLAEATRMLTDEHGVDHIDLNFGCPAAKVTRKGGGAALPIKRALFRNIVQSTVAAAGDVPVTVKMRMGIDDDHLTFIEAAKTAAGEGVAAIALHARTAEQLYSGSARWAAIGELKAAIDDVPVLGNGDIWEASDAVDMMASTGCDGVVIGRGCLGKPWLFRDLVAAFRGDPVPAPPLVGEVAQVMIAHATALVSLMGEPRGLADFRKHVGWYLTGYPVGGAVRRDGGQVGTIDGLRALLERVDPTLALPAGNHRLARGHTNGPRQVRLPEDWLEDLDDPTPPRGAGVMVSGG